MDYNVLVYQVFSWLPFKFDLASKMYCKVGAPGLPGCPKSARRSVNGWLGRAKQLAFRKSFRGRMQIYARAACRSGI
jgi:hypothetical protein